MMKKINGFNRTAAPLALITLLMGLAGCAALRVGARTSALTSAKMSTYVFTQDIKDLKKAANNQALTVTAMQPPESLVRNHPYFYKGKYYSEQIESTQQFAGGFSLISGQALQEEDLVGMDVLYKDGTETLFALGPYFYRITKKAGGHSLEAYQVGTPVWQDRPHWLNLGILSISFGDERVFDADRSLARATRRGDLEMNVLERLDGEAADRLRQESKAQAEREEAARK